MDITPRTETPQDIQKEIKKHLVIYLLLLLLTAVNFFLSRMHLSAVQTLIGVLSIALLQGSLVACYFMHLMSEKKIIHFVLLLTIIFFGVLLSLPILQFLGKLYGMTHVS